MIPEGTTIGSYRILRPIGRGGMGEIYEAEPLRAAPGAPATVAIKVIRPDRMDAGDLAARLRKEARLIERIHHPNILPVYGIEDVDGAPAVVMRMIDGIDLAEMLGGVGRLDWREAFDLLIPVASALEAAHETGVIHRDVKPANVLLERLTEGRYHPYLTDFGIALMHNDERLTDPAVTLGTFDYLAPEQITEGAERADGRADTYSFGCMLFRCISGAPPFADTQGPATLFAHVNTPPPRLGDLVPDLPGEVDDFIARCLAKDPDARPQRLPLEMRRILPSPRPAGEETVATVKPSPSGTQADREQSRPPRPKIGGESWRARRAPAAAALFGIFGAIAVVVILTFDAGGVRSGLGVIGGGSGAPSGARTAPIGRVSVATGHLMQATLAQCGREVAVRTFSSLEDFRRSNGSIDGATAAALHAADSSIPSSEDVGDAGPSCEALKVELGDNAASGRCRPRVSGSKVNCFTVSVGGMKVKPQQYFTADYRGGKAPVLTCSTFGAVLCSGGRWDAGRDTSSVRFSLASMERGEVGECLNLVTGAASDALRDIGRPATREQMFRKQPVVVPRPCGGASFRVATREPAPSWCKDDWTTRGDVAGSCVHASSHLSDGQDVGRAISVDLNGGAIDETRYFCYPKSPRDCPSDGTGWEWSTYSAF